ncbi:unnamed protein product [Lepeophtheirus salmonis]|uniref:(salmon louse) hypothetical protein n=1 Tax=Lepeophtheirus salmonis TaxID=72036 RepID=A0A7R8H0W5_LEPSM|nr:unnamed protein product [Lepeophtheirus salmonis]CAF2797099.1 unnamed protein product [Lepeophtheirus salmonis]
MIKPKTKTPLGQIFQGSPDLLLNAKKEVGKRIKDACHLIERSSNTLTKTSLKGKCQLINAGLSDLSPSGYGDFGLPNISKLPFHIQMGEAYFEITQARSLLKLSSLLRISVNLSGHHTLQSCSSKHPSYVCEAFNPFKNTQQPRNIGSIKELAKEFNERDFIYLKSIFGVLGELTHRLE